MKKVLLLPVGLILIGLVACQKDPGNNLNNDESRIYITNHNESADFTSYSTFSIVDSVAVISNNQLSGKQQNALDVALINAVIDNMEARGYTLVDNNSNPDLAITVSRIYNDYSGIISYGDYWNYYGGYWDPYYWGYPGYSYYYPPVYGVYTISDGAIEVDMFDLKNANSSNELTYLWNGMIRGTGTFNTGNASSGIGSLFEQSPYLTRN